MLMEVTRRALEMHKVVHFWSTDGKATVALHVATAPDQPTNPGRLAEEVEQG